MKLIKCTNGHYILRTAQKELDFADSKSLMVAWGLMGYSLEELIIGLQEMDVVNNPVGQFGELLGCFMYSEKLLCE